MERGHIGTGPIRMSSRASKKDTGMSFSSYPKAQFPIVL